MQEVGAYNSGLCKLKFSDPTNYLLEQARQLMFRTAIAGGNSTNIQSIVGASQVRTTGVCRSHFLFLGIAFGVSVMAMAIVLATFGGYW